MLPPKVDGLTVVGEAFCSPFSTTFLVKDDCLSWSAENATILDSNSNTIFTVVTKGLSGRKVLRDVAGNSVCVMQAKTFSAHDKWRIFRGEATDTSAMVATISRESWNTHGGAAKGLQVQLATGDRAEYILRPQGTFTGRQEYQLVHHGQVIGEVKRERLGDNWYSNKQGYMVTIGPGYDHAFLLCVVVILGRYYHQERATGLYGAA